MNFIETTPALPKISGWVMFAIAMAASVGLRAYQINTNNLQSQTVLPLDPLQRVAAIYKANPTPENLQVLVTELSRGKIEATKLLDRMTSTQRPLRFTEDNFFVLQSTLEETGSVLATIANLDDSNLQRLGFNSRNDASHFIFRFFDISYFTQNKFLQEQFHKLDKMGIDFDINIKNNTDPEDQKIAYIKNYLALLKKCEVYYLKIEHFHTANNSPKVEEVKYEELPVTESIARTSLLSMKEYLKHQK